jgi:hypothetical protein
MRLKTCPPIGDSEQFPAWAKIGRTTIEKVVKKLLPARRYFLIYIFVVLNSS